MVLLLVIDLLLINNYFDLCFYSNSSISTIWITSNSNCINSNNNCFYRSKGKINSFLL